MISRSRHGRDGWLSVFRRLGKTERNSPEFLDTARFELAVEKERCRAERRELAFCIILFDFDELSPVAAEACHADLAGDFRRRLRITDEIGIFRDALAVLLPETISSEAAGVANDLTAIAAARGIKVATEIFAWPDVEVDQPPPNQPGRTGIVEIETGTAANDQDDNGRAGEVSPQDGIQNASGFDSDNEITRHTVKVQRLSTIIPTPLWKRTIDVAGASLGLILLSPVFLMATIMVRLTSPGPAYFTQWREGKDGQLFRIYKFRTMRTGAEGEQTAFRKMSEQDGPAFKIKDDPRLTSIGRYLRKSCVDELPQLFNVLKGEMSLVGPRPLPVDESLNCSPWHRRRLDVLPGMTCFWQVDGGREIPFDDWMRMDLDYVRQRSLLTDIRLICKTALVTILHRGSV